MIEPIDCTATVLKPFLTDTLMDRGSLSKVVDLDTVTAPGIYNVDVSSSGTIENSPGGARQGQLIVIKGSTTFGQIFLPLGTSEMPAYRINWYGLAWKPWHPFLKVT